MTRHTQDGSRAAIRSPRRPEGEGPADRPGDLRRGRRSIAARAAGIAAVALLAAACGSSKPSAPAPSSPSTSSSSAPSTSSTPSTPSSPSSTPSPSPTTTATAPADQAAAKAQITANWQKFFDPMTSLADKQKFLENGDKLAPLLQAFSADPRVGQVTAKVSDVAFTSPTMATVTYALSLQGTVVIPNSTGQAVLQDGTWKVSDSSLCALVALSGKSSLPGCS